MVIITVVSINTVLSDTEIKISPWFKEVIIKNQEKICSIFKLIKSIINSLEKLIDFISYVQQISHESKNKTINSSNSSDTDSVQSKSSDSSNLSDTDSIQLKSVDSPNSSDTDSIQSKSSSSSNKSLMTESQSKNQLSRYKRIVRSISSHKTKNLNRQKRFLSNSFNPKTLINDAIKLLEDSILKTIQSINFKQIFEQIINKLDISSMIKKSLGNINEVIEKNLDIPNTLIKEFKKIKIESYIKDIIEQADFISTIKKKINDINFETTFNELMKQIDLKTIINEQINHINVTQIVNNLIELTNIDQTIKTILSKIDPIQVLQRSIDSIDFEKLFEKFVAFNDAVSPWNKLLKLLELDEISDHIQDPFWILQKILPDINQQSISHIIEDIRNTLEEIGNGTTKMKDVMLNLALEKGIPFLIETLKSQNPKFGPLSENKRLDHVSISVRLFTEIFHYTLLLFLILEHALSSINNRQIRQW